MLLRLALLLLALSLLCALVGSGWLGPLTYEPARLAFLALLQVSVVLFVVDFVQWSRRPPEAR